MASAMPRDNFKLKIKSGLGVIINRWSIRNILNKIRSLAK